MLGHRIARDGGTAGIDQLGAAMLVALLAAALLGFNEAMPAFKDPVLLAAAVGGSRSPPSSTSPLNSTRGPL